MSDAKPSRTKRSPEERLEAARQAAARAADRHARKLRQVQKYEAVQRSRERKLDTRRKIIAGALALEHMRHNTGFAAAFRDLLNTYVTKDAERELFGLEPLAAEEIRIVPPAIPTQASATATPMRAPHGPNAFRDLRSA